MRFITDGRLDKMIQDAIKDVGMESYKKGFSDGLHKGLTTDKEGIHMNGNGVYVFKDGNQTGAVK